MFKQGCDPSKQFNGAGISLGDNITSTEGLPSFWCPLFLGNWKEGQARSPGARSMVVMYQKGSGLPRLQVGRLRASWVHLR